MKTVTRVSIVTEQRDPLEGIRRALAFADSLVEMGAKIEVTGELGLNIRFEPAVPEPKQDGAFAEVNKP